MDILKNLLLVVELICSILLIGIILIQKSKGGGLGGSAFGGAAETVFGARAGNILTKITIGLSILFMVNTLFLSFFFAGTQDRSVIQADPVVQDVPAAPVPVTGPIDTGPAGVTAPPAGVAPVETLPAAEVPAPQS